MDSSSSATLPHIGLHSRCIPTLIAGDISGRRFVVLKFSTLFPIFSGQLVNLLIRRKHLSGLTGFNLVLV